MTILAIDPGLEGGVAWLSPVGFWTCRMPIAVYRYGSDARRRAKAINHVDVGQLHKIARDFSPKVIVVEQQTAMPKQSMQSTATSFVNYGLVLSLRLVAPVHLVHPAT